MIPKYRRYARQVTVNHMPDQHLLQFLGEFVTNSGGKINLLPKSLLLYEPLSLSTCSARPAEMLRRTRMGGFAINR
jgi:hypothetical protein